MPNYYCQNCNDKISDIFTREAEDFQKNYKNIKKGKIAVCKKCKDCLEQSKNNLQEILSLETEKKLVLGGPGTGKTFLFHSVLENFPKQANILVITFINNLVDELEKRLSDIPNDKIEIRTLHSFCKGFLLNKIHSYNYLPELPEIIKNDYSLIECDFDERSYKRALVNLEENDEVEKYFSRASYYDCVGHDDALHKVFQYLNADNTAIPKYSQIIIDEYQDFNFLESKLVSLLGQGNKIMIAGDDDQALYRFKSASPDHIRNLYKDKNFNSRFLIFCRRCTSIMVDATNAFISNALKQGLLEKKTRIDKEFKCYWPDKFFDSKKYQNIILGKCTTDSIVAKHIVEKITSIVKDEKIQPNKEGEPEFLIVGPPRRKNFLQKVNEELDIDKRIDKNIFEIEYKSEPDKLSVEEGYKLIVKDNNSNLGWRIVLYKDPIGSSGEIDRKIIYESFQGKNIIELLPEEYVEKHKKEIQEFSSPQTVEAKKTLNKKIKIKLTSYLQAKGLSANHVFVLGLEDGIFPANPLSITKDEVCQFIVLLTRARKSLRILSVNNRYNTRLRRRGNLSSFISMIPNEYFDANDINASNYNEI